jgi:hypothetical protein
LLLRASWLHCILQLAFYTPCLWRSSNKATRAPAPIYANPNEIGDEDFAGERVCPLHHAEETTPECIPAKQHRHGGVYNGFVMYDKVRCRNTRVVYMTVLTPSAFKLSSMSPRGPPLPHFRTSCFEKSLAIVINVILAGQSPAARIGLSVIAVLTGYVLWFSFTSPLNKCTVSYGCCFLCIGHTPSPRIDQQLNALYSFLYQFKPCGLKRNAI